MNAKQIAGIVATVFVVILVAGFIQDPFGWRKREMDRLRADKTHAEQTADLATHTVQTIEKYHTTERVVIEKAEEKAHDVEAIPSGDIPPDVLDAWHDGLRDVRAAGSGDRGSAEPSPTLRQP